jgi:hypothetical protein
MKWMYIREVQYYLLLTLYHKYNDTLDKVFEGIDIDDERIERIGVSRYTMSIFHHVIRRWAFSTGTVFGRFHLTPAI